MTFLVAHSIECNLPYMPLQSACQRYRQISFQFKATYCSSLYEVIFPVPANFNNAFRGVIAHFSGFINGNESIQDPVNMKI